MDYENDNKTLPTAASEIDNAKDINLNLSAEGNAERDGTDLPADGDDQLGGRPTIRDQKFPFVFRGKNEYDRQGDNSKNRSQLKKASGSTQAAAATPTDNSGSGVPAQPASEGSSDQKKPRRSLA